MHLGLLNKLNLGEWPITTLTDVSKNTMPLKRRASSVFAGVSHVVLLHSSCIMAPPLLLSLKALEEFADTCLR